MGPLQPWRNNKRTVTPAQVEMIRRGWPKAKAAGWKRDEWVADVAAMLGISPGHAQSILYVHRYIGKDDDDG